MYLQWSVAAHSKESKSVTYMLYKRRYLVFIEDEGAEGETELRLTSCVEGRKTEVHLPQLESCAIGVKWPHKPKQALCVMNIFL